MKFVAFVATLAAPSLAQDLSARIPVGGEVEIHTRQLIVSSLKGRVASVDSNRIGVMITKAGTTVQIPWRHVERLEWTTGKSRVRGLGEGALFGLLFGASVALSNYPFAWPDSDPEKDTQIRRVIQLGTAIAIGGTVIGAALGSRKWTGAPIPRSTAGSIALDLAAADELRVESTRGRISGRNGVAGDSLRFTTGAGSVTLPWRSVGELEVRAGRNRLVGVLLGAGMGFVASALASSFVDVSGAGHASNLLVGAMLGYRYLTPAGWKSLPLPSP